MQNYFHYFSEIEERFQRRRGSILMLSTLDWALIETWREAGIPLEAVLRGIDDAFDKHDAKLAISKTRTKKVNGLAWCAQAVMQATEEMQASKPNASQPSSNKTPPPSPQMRVPHISLLRCGFPPPPQPPNVSAN